MYKKNEIIGSACRKYTFILKTLMDTIGNCLRPVFSIGIPQHGRRSFELVMKEKHKVTK